MKSLLSWFRFGFFGRSMWKALTGNNPDTRLILIVVLFILLFIMVGLAITHFRYAVPAAVIFVLFLGYRIGGGIAVFSLLVGLFALFIGDRKMVDARQPAPEDAPIDDADRQLLLKMDQKARTVLGDKYNQFQRHMVSVQNKRELEYFKTFWEEKMQPQPERKKR